MMEFFAVLLVIIIVVTFFMACAAIIAIAGVCIFKITEKIIKAIENFFDNL